ncbi:MAG: 30S ribosomal protein S20 [candidate division WS2 bacterium]|uniref:Small ribosomal subunit protein bS20 n=1 Tax=Psychracetigena formicireducens TaxID=2986056 RepID=A0A9E2F658_PSYF1|nr:30S ribosomal protein S20 [Candidatus Psychracetigena formicireducens]MBT9144253.1 30S ribosomal protein S20 [Candidatus Psychracetigena formicireducens]MBT9149916.1 30S ribosomal protein S20 [Candidatus Psychracetigena formicireducens]
MANIKSAIKRIKITEKETNINKALKTQVKTATKKCRQAIDSANADLSKEMIRMAQKTIDKACKKGILHKNTASRKKSSLMKSLKV